MTKVLIPFVSRDGKRQEYLTYTLYSHAVTKRWVELIKRSQLLGASFEKGETIYGKGIFSLTELTQIIRDSLNFLTPHYPEVWQRSIFDPIRGGFLEKQEHANLAHIFFEEAIHVSDQDPKNIKPEWLIKLHLLNRAIHQFEVATTDTEGFFIDAYMWNSLRGPISSEENKLFSLDKKWGELYLSYCHIGVSYLEAMETNYPGTPTPQTQLSGNVVLYFQRDMIFQHQKELKAWLENYFKRDVRLEELPLGSIPLGMIEWNDSQEKLEEFFKEYPHLGKEVTFL